MSDTEILMRLQDQVSQGNGMLKEFIESQKAVNMKNEHEHQVIFGKVDWLYLKVGGVLGAIGALTWLAEKMILK